MSINGAVIVVLLFLYIYGPPFRYFSVNISIFLAPFAYYFLIKERIFFKALSNFRKEVFLLLLIGAYSLLISTRGIDVGMMSIPFILVFANLPVCVWIYFLISNNVAGGAAIFKRLVSLLFVVGLISALISIALAMNVEMGEYFKFQLMKYDPEILKFQMHRAFGLSDELLFSYSLVQGVIAILVLRQYGLSISIVLLVSLLFVSIGLNARIGFIVLLFLPFVIKWRIRSLILFSVAVCFLVFILKAADLPFILLAKEQALYFIDELSAINIFDLSASDGTVGILFGEMMFLPDGYWNIFFGIGENIFLSENRPSDIGYMIMLHYGGFFYLLFLALFLLLFFLRGKGGVGGILPISLLCFVFFVANMKGLFFAAKPGMHLFLLVYVFIVGVRLRSDIGVALGNEKWSAARN